MKTYIGIDLGTSAVKLLLMDENGTILRSLSKGYPLEYPQPGWSQQAPEDWLNAVMAGIPELLQGFDGKTVAGIGCGGQMHGLVILDKQDRVIRPAILWNDGRTAPQTAWLNEQVGKDKLSQYTANIAFAGFTAPKLLWVRENEPENFARIAKIMLPKDYINYCLTGVHACDYSDASGMLLLDVKHKCWSREMLEICGVSESQMPKLFESYAPIGTLMPELADALGLSREVAVAAGAGDNAAAAVGTGTVGDGDCNISLGTSGTVFVSQDAFSVDAQNALHSFAHASGKYHLMGCILSAASCNLWWMEEVLKTQDFAAEQADLEALLGKNDVYFLPYLMGERSPHNDVNARGGFLGLRPDTGRAHMTLAVLEGVAFALRDCLEVAKENGLTVPRTKICGGGAKSKLWRKILANVLGIPVDVPRVEEGPAYGGGILAMVACGAYPNVESACASLTAVASTVEPDAALTEAYERNYQNFRAIYPACKALFATLAR